jgi:signal transduction histidine kinase
VVERALATVEAEVATRELTVELDIPEALAAAADARLLGRVFGCLLDNAVRYAGRRGRISIRAAEDDGQVVIAVGNSGPALTADERARVFEREFRIAERSAGARRGRGLGLYFCRLVVEAHGGSIAVASPPHLPVEFVVRLPVR